MFKVSLLGNGAEVSADNKRVACPFDNTDS